ncbi:MAG: sensor histidine kinase [Candidatus Limnocylindrales bacterium]
MKTLTRARARPRGLSPVQPSDGRGGPSVAMLSIRVAMAASAIVGLAYVLIAVVVVIFVTNNLTAGVDDRLNRALAPVPNEAGPNQPFGQPGTAERPFGPPVLMWRISPTGSITSLNTSNIDLPAAYRRVVGPVTVSVGGADIRVEGASRGDDYVVVGMTMEDVSQTESTLIVAEIGIGCALLIVVFLGAVAIGRRVALPIERARRRQLEFTADASHELRTPLSVIEAQATLALARDRDAAWDDAAFGRIDGELKRTRRLVDDMLWLARFDSTGGPVEAEPVDVKVLAAQTADRFGAVAEARKQTLTVDRGSTREDAIVIASPEWLDRLVGVLLDNACKYSPEGGDIAVRVAAEGRRVRLTVDDSGPGIPTAERSRVFDRFHRATDLPGGAGLGLAIADAIVHATGGRWHIGISPLGGASVSVSWPRAMSGHREVDPAG